MNSLLGLDSNDKPIDQLVYNENSKKEKNSKILNLLDLMRFLEKITNYFQVK